MRPYCADLHIHSTLSPCGSLEMSAYDIVTEAVNKGLDIIALTDHNATQQVENVKLLGAKHGLYVLPGVEVNTKEEVHCLVYFETVAQLQEFQKVISAHMPSIKNDPELFGDQVWVDENGFIEGEIEDSLIVALDLSLNELAKKVKSMGGLFVPAHVDKQRNSVLSQLGFIPTNASIDAIEVVNTANYYELIMANPELKRWSVMSNSDAHYLKDIGLRTTIFNIKSLSFEEIVMAMHHEGGRWMCC